MNRIKNFLKDDRGIGVIEMVLILLDIRGIPKLCKYCLMQRAFR